MPSASGPRPPRRGPRRGPAEATPGGHRDHRLGHEEEGSPAPGVATGAGPARTGAPPPSREVGPRASQGRTDRARDERAAFDVARRSTRFRAVAVGRGRRGMAVPAANRAALAPATANAKVLSRSASARGDDCADPPAKPTSTSHPTPVYPAAEIASGIAGKVRVEIAVDEHGRVVSARILQGLGPAFDEAALAAARASTFEPALRCGRPSVSTFKIVPSFRPPTHGNSVFRLLRSRSSQRFLSRRSRTQAPARHPLRHAQARPPRLTQFVEAPYPRARRPGAGPPRSSWARDKRGGNRRSGGRDAVRGSRVRRRGRARWHGNSSSSRRRLTAKPATMARVVYQYEFVLRQFRPRPPSPGQVRDRTNEEAALLRSAWELDGGSTSTTDAGGRFSAYRRGRAGRAHRVTLSGEHLTALQTKETCWRPGISSRRRTTSRWRTRRRRGGPRRPRGRRRRNAPIEARWSRRRCPPIRGGACRGRRATCSRSWRTCPASRGASVGSGQVVVWGRRQEGHARVPRRRAAAAPPTEEVSSPSSARTWCSRSSSSPEAGSGVRPRDPADSSASSSKPIPTRKAYTGASPPICSTLPPGRTRAALRSGRGRNRRTKELSRRASAGLQFAQHRSIHPDPPLLRRSSPRRLGRIAAGDLEVGGLISSDAEIDDTVPSDDPTSQQQQTHDSSFPAVLGALEEADRRRRGGLTRSSVGAGSDLLVDASVRCRPSSTVASTMASVRATGKQVARWVTLTASADAQLTKGRFNRTGSNTSPPRPGDEFVFGQAFRPIRSPTTTRTVIAVASAAPFVSGGLGTLADGQASTSSPRRLRLEPYLLTASRMPSRVPASTPPVGLFQRVDGARAATLGAVEPGARADLEGRQGDLTITAGAREISLRSSGNPTVGLKSAEHSAGRGRRRDAGRPLVRDDGVSTSRRKASPSGFALPSPLASLKHWSGTGIGRTRGIQFLLRKQASQTDSSGWVTYTLSKSRRASALGRPVCTPYDFDQTR